MENLETETVESIVVYATVPGEASGPGEKKKSGNEEDEPGEVDPDEDEPDIEDPDEDDPDPNDPGDDPDEENENDNPKENSF